MTSFPYMILCDFNDSGLDDLLVRNSDYKIIYNIGIRNKSNRSRNNRSQHS